MSAKKQYTVVVKGDLTHIRNHKFHLARYIGETDEIEFYYVNQGAVARPASYAMVFIARWMFERGIKQTNWMDRRVRNVSIAKQPKTDVDGRVQKSLF